jgi:hypothetical protein
MGSQCDEVPVGPSALAVMALVRFPGRAVCQFGGDTAGARQRREVTSAQGGLGAGRSAATGSATDHDESAASLGWTSEAGRHAEKYR